MGIVEAPDQPLTENEWSKVKDQSNQREDSVQPCPICKEDFGLHQQVGATPLSKISSHFDIVHLESVGVKDKNKDFFTYMYDWIEFVIKFKGQNLLWPNLETIILIGNRPTKLPVGF